MQNSYTLEELAKFLNRPEKEIQKLAEKEVLKGRKIQGKWVFALADVALWMEQEMTEFEVEKTEQLEQAIIQSAVEAEEEISLVSILDPGQSIFLFCKTKASVIRKMAELAENNGKLWDVDSMIEALRAREDMASTALENGVAIMHPRRPRLISLRKTFSLWLSRQNLSPLAEAMTTKQTCSSCSAVRQTRVICVRLANLFAFLKRPIFWTIYANVLTRKRFEN